MARKLFIQIHNATTPDALPLYVVSHGPFENSQIDLDRHSFHSYKTLRAGLVTHFGVPETMIPGKLFFESSREELCSREEPIYRTITY
jgi:hypothetical protein